MSLAAVGIAPGDKVITSAFTFLASASCALHQNAIPVFVDIDPRTYGMDPTKLEAAITERTKAIIPVHIQGCPADMDPILAIAKNTTCS
jgi:dTDP-4-amino-4,6-dideoxygalactose transaminase